MDWSQLNNQQLGAYAEYFTKMEFIKRGLPIFSVEVDDRGIDFVIRISSDRYLDVQVKSVRNLNYVFIPKDKFINSENFFVALVLFGELDLPGLYLIPACAWRSENALFKYKAYEGLKSKPEFDINLSRKNLPLLEEYEFAKVIAKLLNAS